MKKIFFLILATAICGSTWAQTAWTKHESPVLEKGTAGSWEGSDIGFPSVLFINNVYHMWYAASGADGIFAIGHATSSDGLFWIKDVANPVLKKGPSGSWDDKWVYIPKVIYEDSIFHMWYTGRNTGNLERGGYATSSDGVTWTKHAGNPVLSSGATGEWDAGHVGPGAVIYSDSKYHMWYGASSQVGSELFKSGYTTSPDGFSWTRHPDNPVLDNGGSTDWDYPRTQAASVIFNGSDYEMWYGGGEFFKWRVGHATSPDGIQWTRDAGNPVLDWGSAGSWDANFVGFPSVLYDPASSKYKMWYFGSSDNNGGAIGCAERRSNYQTLHVPAEFSSIQAAIDASIDGDTILVAEGTYYENIYFRGKAIMLTSEFILDGDTSHISKTIINGSEPPHPDSATVVTLDNCQDTTSVLCGFTILEGGGTTVTYNIDNWRVGGGIRLQNTSGKILNNIIQGNLTKDTDKLAFGGGIYCFLDDNENNNVIIRNNIVFNNHCNSNIWAVGAGISALCKKGNIVIENNHIYNNTCTSTEDYMIFGAGLEIEKAYGHPGAVTVRNNYIHHNELHSQSCMGGGMYLEYYLREYNEEKLTNNVPVQVYNNVFSDNYSQDKGGGVGIWNLCPFTTLLKETVPDPLFFNNTLINNRAADGAGIFHYDAETVMMNNILWNDLSAEGCREIFNENINYPGVYNKQQNDGIIHSFYNTVQNGFPGLGNISDDPLIDTIGFTLPETSPSIGWGIDSVHLDDKWYAAPKYDIHGKNRMMASDDHKVDMGAVESDFEQIKRPVIYDSEHVLHVTGEKSTIQAAINAAQTGDTVLVAPGLYYENIDFKGKAITVMSHYGIDGGEQHIQTTVIDGSLPLKTDTSSVVLMISGEDTASVLKGFTITGGSGTFENDGVLTTKAGGGILMRGGTVENNIITGNHLKESGTDWVLGAGIAASNDQNHMAIIRNNSIDNNTIECKSPAFGGGLCLAGAHFKIEHNRIFENVCSTTDPNCQGGGIGWWSMDPSIVPTLRIAANEIYKNNLRLAPSNLLTAGGGIYLLSTVPESEIDLLNNLVYENTVSGYGGGLALVGTKNALIRNNTIYNNLAWAEGHSLFLGSSSSVVLFNNILYSKRKMSIKEICHDTIDGENTLYAFYNDVRGGLEGEGNIDSDPLLNLQPLNLQNGSPCIGTGTASVEVLGKTWFAPATDCFGNARPNACDQKVDMGALESSLMTGITLPQVWASSLKIFPNPADGITTLQFTLDKPLHTKICILNLLGQEERILLDETRLPGKHEVSFDTSTLKSGIYIVRITTDKIFSAKLVVK